VSQLIEASIEIDAPIATVWATVHDPAVWVEGIDWVREVWWEDDHPPGRGSVYAERVKLGIKETIYRWELTVFEPPRRAVHSHTSGEGEADLEVLVEPIADGRTRYTQRMHIRAFPVFRPLGWLLERTAVRWKMQRDFERMILPNYKRIAERRAAS
jgi:carbon monoxide dehydrogenase subunit G